ncbi:MAG: FAD-dependent oxidoreductase [Gammaproteobacteria bacterium]|jgi:3-phenylpropionate/trans-cinnamate dioxygenase ferredoxin reductase subunit
MHEHLVIAGGGQAATQAAQSARQAGFDGAITLVAAEPCLPYQRPPLSKSFLSGDLERSRLFLKPETFYESRDIELRLSTRVVSIDPSRMRVELDSEESIACSHLLLATGSAPRRLQVPGADLEGIYSLRTIADVESIKRDLDGAERLLIVGAGYIGLEVAAVASRSGIEVTVLEAGAHALSRSVCPEVADFLVENHRQAGVDFRFSGGLDAFLGDSRVRGIATDNGDRIECDLAIVAVGIVPQTALAESAGLEIDNGIAVDAAGRTSAPGIFSAGDCTSHLHPWVGRRIRLESVHNAIEQGKAAAASICGQEAAFDAIPWFWSDQYDLKLQIAGLSEGYDRIVLRGRPDDGAFSAFYLEAGRVIAVDSVNDPRTFIAARKFLVDKPAWSAETIADTDCDLNKL